MPQSIQGVRDYGSDITQIISHRMTLNEIADVFKRKAPNNSLKIQFARQ